MARSMLQGLNLSTELWAEASNATVYILNRVYGSTTLEEKTPHEMWHRKKRNLATFESLGPMFLPMYPKTKERSLIPPGANVP